MSDEESAIKLHDIWANVVAHLIADSATTIDPKTAAFLGLVRLEALLPSGYALLTTPHDMAKKAIDDYLEPISTVLSALTGKSLHVAVTVANEISSDEQHDHTESFSSPVHTSEEDKPSSTLSESPTAYPTSPTPLPGLFSSQEEKPAEVTVEKKENEPHHAHEWEHSYIQEVAIPPSTPDSYRIEAGMTATPPTALRSAPGMTNRNAARIGKLNKNFTFERFVQGQSNRLAYTAMRVAAEKPATKTNPLFVWGNSGLGKTHLLHAAGHLALQLRPESLVLYVTMEEFTNDFISSLRDADENQSNFKEFYRKIDFLLIDDVQFLSSKVGTQEEFFHTFNTLLNDNKQIILSSDRSPHDLVGMEERLITRFNSGLTVDLQPPDFETRIAILERKALLDNLHIPRDVLSFIAQMSGPSIRELEGALKNVVLFCQFNSEEVNLNNAMIALKMDGTTTTISVTAEAIITATAEHFSLPIKALTGTSKKKEVAHARQIAMFLCRELTDLSLPKIGTHFGNRDHTTVLYTCRKIMKEIEAQPALANEISIIRNHITNGEARK